jgi:hypothetical protein
VVGGGYSLLYADVLARTLAKQLYLGRGRHVLGVSPLLFFPVKFAHLNLMGWIITTRKLSFCDTSIATFENNRRNVFFVMTSRQSLRQF